MSKCIIGVCQMCVGDDKSSNFAQAKSLVEECKRRGSVMAFLPEACDYISETAEDAVSMAESISCDKDTVFNKYCSLAKDVGIWLSLGGVHRRCENDPDGKIRNSHVIIDNYGNIQCCYDKCHLFNVDIPSKITLKETDTTVPGDTILRPISSPVGNIGAMTCYDVRFPQISTILRQHGADILTYPSAFTVPTGHAHWQVLLRARAIENQCYVVAAAQVGKHNMRRSSFGHSMVVDPWGTVLACAADRKGVVIAEIDLDYLRKLRVEMPVFNHCRPDVYVKPLNSA